MQVTDILAEMGGLKCMARELGIGDGNALDDLLKMARKARQ